MKNLYNLLILPPLFVLLALISFPVIAAYKAHVSTQDSMLFVDEYPQAKGTKLDNCFLCHTGGEVKDRYLNDCDYCHAVYGYRAPHPPGSLEKTLNAYGAAYLEAGRNAEAFRIIAGIDSDGDGFSNEEEIKDGSLPGDKNDNPATQEAPAVIYNRTKLNRLPRTNQFMAFDTAKFGDYYAVYSGVKVWDLLLDAGVLETATDITIYSISGYSRNFPINEIKQGFDQGKFFSRYPWIKHPAEVPFKDGRPIPGKQFFIVAFERDGFPLLEGKMKADDKGHYHMYGEGPYRFISPSLQPIVPDRSQWSIDRDEPPYPFNPDRPVPKNADYCIKSIVAIQVNTADNKSFRYNWSEKQLQMAANGELVVYGAIRPRELGRNRFSWVQN
ncbi:GEGP motif-containing diheme protein [Desulfuromonas sp. CSMB_57]|uniref:GEGP motif-containing diheme protein n=1 Tax=Desulfuromonas sp. CSMB_57 TaxID=2807629 RepID=UPI001CD61C01|nr:GEGP motif-containing diheme protein [Desulfuromonas sp. CSMB_57]